MRYKTKRIKKITHLKKNWSFKKNTEILHQVCCFFFSFKKLQDWVDLNIYSFMHLKKLLLFIKKPETIQFFVRHMHRHRQ